MSKSGPNICITGTPGTGKTTLASELAQKMGLNHLNVGTLVKEQSLHDGWDEEFQCYITNEDKICDALEDIMSKGNNIVDFHSCDFFPERWFDLVIVLRTDNSILYPRLENRNYSSQKISENIEAEIMRVVLDEALESYSEDIVHELQSNTVQDMEQNVDYLINWINQWKLTH